MGRTKGAKNKPKEVDPLAVNYDPDKIKVVMQGILELDREKAKINDQIKELKNQAVEAGATKKEISEAIRLSRIDDDEERNDLLSGASRALETIGCQPIRIERSGLADDEEFGEDEE